MENQAMFKIGYGLYVLTAKNAGKDNGCIVNTLMQVTQDPLQVMLTVNKVNLTHDMILGSGEFNVSVLTQEAKFELFQRFGFHSGRDTDKFSGFEGIKRAGNGILYVTESTNAFLSGKVISETDLGTHTLFLARVTDAAVLSDAESVTYSYYQANIKPKPQKTGKKGWRCTVCGYIYEGDELPADFICPICKHGAADFVRIEE